MEVMGKMGGKVALWGKIGGGEGGEEGERKELYCDDLRESALHAYE